MLHEHISLELDSAMKNKFTDSELPELLKVWIVLTHTDMPINNRLYKRNEVSKLVDTYVKPYFKPVLLHHDDHSDPIGRVVELYYIPRESFLSETERLVGKKLDLPKDATGAVLLKAYITDKVGIQKILSGLYSTVSIGFVADDLRCSICDKKIDFFAMAFGQSPETEEYCTHRIGQEYDGQILYAVPYGIQYNEISFVNVPADSYAGLAKVTVLSLDEAINAFGVEVENEQLATVNSTYVVANSNSNKLVDSALDNLTDANKQKEADDMEVEKLKQELEAVKEELAALKDENKKLKALVDEYKVRLIDELVTLKMLIANVSEEEAAAMKDEYAKYDLATVKVLLADYSKIADKLIDTDEEAEQTEVEEVKSVETNEQSSEVNTKSEGNNTDVQMATQEQQVEAKEEDAKCENAAEEKVEIKRDHKEEVSEKKFEDVLDPFAVIDLFLKGKH